MKKQTPENTKPLSLSAFGKTLSPRMSCEGLRKCIAAGRLSKGLVIVNGKPKVENPEAAARELANNSRKPREHVPVLSPFTEAKLSGAEVWGEMSRAQLINEIQDVGAMLVELAYLLLAHGVTEEEVAEHLAPLAGDELPDDAVEQLHPIWGAAIEIDEERDNENTQPEK